MRKCPQCCRNNGGKAMKAETAARERQSQWRIYTWAHLGLYWDKICECPVKFMWSRSSN